MPTEKALEKHGAKAAKRLGIFVVKLGALGGGGWPDHTFFKGGRVAFIEYKIGESAKFQPLQKYYLNLLDGLGFKVAVCWTKDQVNAFLEEFESEVQTAQVSGASAPEDDGTGSTSTSARSGDGKDSDMS